MKSILASLLCLTFVLGNFASKAQITHTNNGTVDQNAETLLKQAAQKMNSGTVSFTVTMISKNADKKETSRHSAKVLYNKGKYRVTTNDQALYCDGKSVWHWNKSNNECVVNNVSSSDDDLMNPALLLNNYSKNYRAKFIRTEEDGTAVVDLTPKKARSFYKIRMQINSTNGIIKSMTLHNYDSSSAEYSVSNFKTGVSSTEADFSFPASQNPKVEVIDMR